MVIGSLDGLSDFSRWVSKKGPNRTP